jgi:hypothetical protein
MVTMQCSLQRGSECRAWHCPLHLLLINNIACDESCSPAEELQSGSHTVHVCSLCILTSAHPGHQFKKLDAAALGPAAIDTAGARVTLLWSAFCVQYFMPKLREAMDGWVALLSPDGVIAVCEIDGLFSCHSPLTDADAEAFRVVDAEVLPSKGYDPFAARGVEAAMVASGLVPIGSTEWHDPELSFQGPATAEIAAAWSARFDRPHLHAMLVERFGYDETVRLRLAFLSCITSRDHRTTSAVRLVMARKPTGVAADQRASS